MSDAEFLHKSFLLSLQVLTLTSLLTTLWSRLVPPKPQAPAAPSTDLHQITRDLNHLQNEIYRLQTQLLQLERDTLDRIERLLLH